MKMRQLHLIKAAGGVFISLLFLLNKYVFAEPYKCSNEDVKVHAERQSDIAFACSAIDETYAFLRTAGLVKHVSIDLHIVSKLPRHDLSEFCLGYYHKIKNSIYVLSYDACKCRIVENGFWDLTFSRDLHNSFIIHEIAHAIAGAHFEVESHSIAAEEYIPYTTQIALMPEDLRKELLTKITNEGFENEQEITSLFHDLSPSVFAVKAYRHFSRQDNGNKFYQQILKGKCRLNGEE